MEKETTKKGWRGKVEGDDTDREGDRDGQRGGREREAEGEREGR